MSRFLFLLASLLTIILVACDQAGTPTSSSSSSSADQSSPEIISSSESSSSSVTPVAMMRIVRSASSRSMQSSAAIRSSSASSEWNLEAALKAMPKTKDAWLKVITPDQYSILWEAGTETPFTSPLLNEHRKGTFVTADCGEPVFRSEQKYDSGTGWPSFWAPISADALVLRPDNSLGMQRTEVLSKCGGHLGHVFDDGPQPTGLRYCMNGLALKFIPDPGQ